MMKLKKGSIVCKVHFGIRRQQIVNDEIDSEGTYIVK